MTTTTDEPFAPGFGQTVVLAGDPEQERREQNRLVKAAKERAKSHARQREAEAAVRARLADLRDENERAKRQRQWDVGEAADNLAGWERVRRDDALLKAVHTINPNNKASLRQTALACDDRAKHLDKISAEARSASISRIYEPDVYGVGSATSWFRDVGLAAQYDPDNRDPEIRESRERLRRYSHDIGRRALDLTSEGERIRRSFRDMARRPDDLRHVSEQEYRSLTSGEAAIVVPDYAVAHWAKYRSYVPTFTEQATTAQPLPDFGLRILLPRVTAPAGVDAQTGELFSLTESDPTAEYVEGYVLTFGGQITVSLPLVNRAGPQAADVYLYGQLREALDYRVNSAVLNAALAGAASFSRSGSFTTANFLSDVGRMAASLESTPGTVLPAQIMLAPPKLAEFILATAVDGAQRPIFPPAHGAGTRVDNFTGYAPAGIPWWMDGALVADGSSEVVVANRSAVFVYAGEPLVRAIPNGAYAGSLAATFIISQYVCIDVRYPSGIAVTKGSSAYPADPWA